MHNISKLAFVFSFLLALTGCASTTHHRYRSGPDGAPDFYVDFNKIPNAVPKVEPLSKYGNMPSYVVAGKRYYVLKSSQGYDKTGIASWYGTKFYKHKTSSGERYNMLAMTAASKVLPLPTFVQVTNLQNGKQVIVKVNDRGPFHEDRILDLSYAAAGKLGMLAKGTALVEVKAINPRHPEETLESTPSVHVGRAEIYLQFGAFGVYNNAKHMQEKVNKVHTGYTAKIIPGYLNDEPIYKVQIGPIDSVDDNDALRSKLESNGLSPITVVK